MRETAAQALGAAVQPLPVPQAQALLSLLHQLVQQQQWDVRHGGLLGLKYLLAARTDASQDLMPQALPAATLGLQVKSHLVTPPLASECATNQQVHDTDHRQVHGQALSVTELKQWRKAALSDATYLDGSL